MLASIMVSCGEEDGGFMATVPWGASQEDEEDQATVSSISVQKPEWLSIDYLASDVIKSPPFFHQPSKRLKRSTSSSGRSSSSCWWVYIDGHRTPVCRPRSP